MADRSSPSPCCRRRTTSVVRARKTNTTWSGENKSLRANFIQDVAYGTEELKLDSGEKITIPNVIRAMVPSRIIKQYISYCLERIRKRFLLKTFNRGVTTGKLYFKDQLVIFRVNKKMRVVMRTYMTGNQSGAEKDNRLLFGEQLMLFFSKSKMVPWKIGPIRSGVKNSRWRRPRKAAMLEDSPPASTEDWDRSHGFPWGHKSRQGHAENAMQLQTRYLQCPVVPNDRGLSGKWPWWRPRDLSPSLAYLGWCKASWDDDLIGNQSKWIKVLTVVGFPSPALLRRVLNQTSHNLRCHELQY